MPVYTYQVIHEDGTEGETFDVVHGMKDPPLEVHPDTGEKVVRVFTAPHVAGWAHESRTKELIGDKNLERHGFSKYVRNGKGHYERRVGSGGPNHIDVD